MKAEDVVAEDASDAHTHQVEGGSVWLELSQAQQLGQNFLHQQDAQPSQGAQHKGPGLELSREAENTGKPRIVKAGHTILNKERGSAKHMDTPSLGTTVFLDISSQRTANLDS